MAKTKTTLTISTARSKIFDIAEQAQKPGVHFTLTENGEPKVVIMSAVEYDSLMETMEIMSDPQILKNIEEAEASYKRGDYVSLAELKKELGYETNGFSVVEKAKKSYQGKKRIK